MTTTENRPRRGGRALIAAAVAAVIAAGTTGAAEAEGTITIASWGGAYQDAQRKAWFEPTAEALGITIKEDTTSGIADVRAQVMSGSVTWDLVQQGMNTCILLEKEGLLDPIGLADMDVSGVPDDVKSEFYIGNLVYGTVLGWRSGAWGDKTPSGWADMYDFDNFPGPRSMRRSPLYALETALIADGVAPGDVYPIDVDRAFAKLEELKPHIVSWWPSGAASAQMVVDGEVDMIGLWNGRIQTAMDAGAPYEYTFDQQILIYDCWLIPKGAPNADLARKALAHMMKPEIQALLPQYINYAPANLDAYDTGLIPEEALASLPTAPGNRETAITFNSQWWAENLDEVTRRFDLFIQE